MDKKEKELSTRVASGLVKEEYKQALKELIDYRQSLAKQTKDIGGDEGWRGTPEEMEKEKEKKRIEQEKRLDELHNILKQPKFEDLIVDILKTDGTYDKYISPLLGIHEILRKDGTPHGVPEIRQVIFERFKLA